MSIGKRWKTKTPHDPRDTKHFMGSVPRWYRQQHGAWPIRRLEKRKLFQHLRQGDWENHLPESRYRDSQYFWWY